MISLHLLYKLVSSVRLKHVLLARNILCCTILASFLTWWHDMALLDFSLDGSLRVNECPLTQGLIPVLALNSSHEAHSETRSH